uniref:DNA-directed RNA polymerase n=1 Tax=Rhizophora mucronata TaxID=61149 RepID=A0A2P2MDL3_RHIMU
MVHLMFYLHLYTHLGLWPKKRSQAEDMVSLNVIHWSSKALRELQGTWLFHICQCWYHQSNGQVMTKGPICSCHPMSCEPMVLDNNVKQ